VLSSDAGSLPEVLGDAAEFLAPRGPEAWAAAVTALLGDTARRGVMAALGRRRAAGFTWERTARLTRETWRDALGGGAAGAGTRGDSRT
jgi:glycosyltransferase involved in cell wall biosynthesis